MYMYRTEYDILQDEHCNLSLYVSVWFGRNNTVLLLILNVQVGLDTDEAAVRYLLQNHCFGTRRVAVVRDIFDRHVSRKHLV